MRNTYVSPHSEVVNIVHEGGICMISSVAGTFLNDPVIEDFEVSEGQW